MISPINNKKYKVGIAAIAMVLVISFIAYDIAWAYPDRPGDSVSRTSTLAPAPFVEQPASKEKAGKLYTELGGKDEGPAAVSPIQDAPSIQLSPKPSLIALMLRRLDPWSKRRERVYRLLNNPLMQQTLEKCFTDERERNSVREAIVRFLWLSHSSKDDKFDMIDKLSDREKLLRARDEMATEGYSLIFGNNFRIEDIVSSGDNIQVEGMKAFIDMYIFEFRPNKALISIKLFLSIIFDDITSRVRALMRWERFYLLLSVIEIWNRTGINRGPGDAQVREITTVSDNAFRLPPTPTNDVYDVEALARLVEVGYKIPGRHSENLLKICRRLPEKEREKILNVGSRRILSQEAREWLTRQLAQRPDTGSGKGGIGRGNAEELFKALKRKKQRPLRDSINVDDLLKSLDAIVSGSSLSGQEKDLAKASFDAFRKARHTEFNSVVLQSQVDGGSAYGWLLGFNTLARSPTAGEDDPYGKLQPLLQAKYGNVIGLSSQVLYLIGDNKAILKEYLFHEIVCPFFGHELAREMQEKLFPENYRIVYEDNADGHKDGALALILKKVLREYDPSDISRSPRPAKSASKPARSLRTKDEIRFMDLFLSLVERNSELFAMLSTRKMGGEDQRIRALERRHVLAEEMALLAYMSSADNFTDERYRQVGAYVFERINRAIQLISQNNEPAAHMCLSGAIHRIGAARIAMQSKWLVRRRAHQRKLHREGRSLAFAQGRYRLFDGASHAMIDQTKLLFKTLWETRRSICDQIDSETSQKLKAEQMAREINEMRAQIMRNNFVLSRAELRQIEDVISLMAASMVRPGGKLRVEEKRLAQILLDTCRQMLFFGDRHIRTVNIFLGTAESALRLRAGHASSSIASLHGSALQQVWAMALERDKDVRLKVYDIIRLITRKRYGEAMQILYGVSKLNGIKGEPEYGSVHNILGPYIKGTKRIDSPSALADMQLIIKKCGESGLLHTMLQRYTNEFVAKTRSSDTEVDRTALLKEVFEYFVKTTPILSGPEPDKARERARWWAKFYQAVNIPLMIDNPHRRSKRVVNPVFGASSAYIFILQFNTLAELFSVNSFAHGRLDAAKAFLSGIKDNPDPRSRRTHLIREDLPALVDALAKDYELDAEQRAILRSCVRIEGRPAKTTNTGNGNLIGKLFLDQKCTTQAMKNITAAIEDGFLVFRYGQGSALYTKDGNEARVKLSGVPVVIWAGYRVQIIEDNPFVQGFSSEDTLFITRTYVGNKVAAMHEMREAEYAERAELLPPHVNGHTLLRGCGTDVRKLVKDAMLRGELSAGFSADAAIGYIKKNMPPARLNEAEIWLIKNNEKDGKAGLALLYGEQDTMFGPIDNEELSRQLQGKPIKEEDLELDRNMVDLARRVMDKYQSSFTHKWPFVEPLLGQRFNDFKNLAFYGNQPQSASHYFNDYKNWYSAFKSIIDDKEMWAYGSRTGDLIRILKILDMRYSYILAKLNWIWKWKMESLWTRMEGLSQQAVRTKDIDERKDLESQVRDLAAEMLKEHTKFMIEYPAPEFLEWDGSVIRAIESLKNVTGVKSVFSAGEVAKPAAAKPSPDKKPAVSSLPSEQTTGGIASLLRSIRWNRLASLYAGALGLSLVLWLALPVNWFTISIAIIAPIVVFIYIAATRGFSWGQLAFFIVTSVLLSIFLPVPWFGLSLAAIAVADIALHKKGEAAAPQATKAAAPRVHKTEPQAKKEDAPPAETSFKGVTIDPEVLKYMERLMALSVQGNEPKEGPVNITNEKIVAAIFRIQPITSIVIDKAKDQEKAKKDRDAKAAQKEKLKQPVWTELRKIERGYSFDLKRDIKTLKKWREIKDEDVAGLANALHGLAQEIAQELREHYSIPETDNDMPLIHELITEYKVAKSDDGEDLGEDDKKPLIEDSDAAKEIRECIALVILRDTILTKKWDKKADDFYVLGGLEFQFRNYGKAEQAFLEAVTMDINNAGYLFALGFTMHYQNIPRKISDAVQWYELSLKAQEAKAEKDRTEADKTRMALTKLLIDKSRAGRSLTAFLKHEGDSSFVGQAGPTDMSNLGRKIARDSSSDGDTTNPFIVKHIDEGRAVEVNDKDETAVTVKFDRSRPRSPPIEARYRSAGIFEKIRKAKDPVLLSKILISKKNFHKYSVAEQYALIKIVRGISLSVIIGHALIGERGSQVVYAHTRTGRHKDKHGLDPTIWIGELLLERLTHQELAHFLLEESQHIMRPPRMRYGIMVYQDRALSDTQVDALVIDHDPGLFNILDERVNGIMGPDTARADTSPYMVSTSTDMAKRLPGQGLQWHTGIKVVDWVPEGDNQIRMLSGKSYSEDDLALTRKVEYKGGTFWLKYIPDRPSRKELEKCYILPQAEILRYLQGLKVPGVLPVNECMEIELPNSVKFKALLFSELPPGKSLRDMMDHCIYEAEAVDMMLKIARAVKRLHDVGVYHWDIKPENIWVTRAGDVILFDFDAAFRSREEFYRRGLDRVSTRLYASENRYNLGPGSLLGKRGGYEPVRDEIYSLGMVLLHMLIRRDTNMPGTPSKYANEQLYRLSMLHSSPGILSILCKALDDGRSDYKSINEFINDLEDFKGTGPVAGPTDMARERPDNMDPSGMNSPRYIDSTHADKIEPRDTVGELIEALGQLTAADMKDRFLPSQARILLSNTLFDDVDRDNLARLLKGTNVEILDPRDLRKRAMNTRVTKDKLAVVMSREDFENKDIWNGSDKEVAVRSSVLILDGKLSGSGYVYTGGVIGLAWALMRQDSASIKRYYNLISGAVLSDDVFELLKKDSLNTVAFAVKAIIKFRPIETADTASLEQYKKMMESYLVAA